MFHIGQQVVCVHDVGCPSANEFRNVPVKAGLYTVRGFVSPDVGYERTPGMLLEEVVNPPWEYKEGVFEPSFHPYHFRPLVQHKTDISVFTRMLHNVPTKEPAACDAFHKPAPRWRLPCGRSDAPSVAGNIRGRAASATLLILSIARTSPLLCGCRRDRG